MCRHQAGCGADHALELCRDAARADVADVALAHGAAGAELDPVDEAGIRGAGRAADHGMESERVRVEDPDSVPSGAEPEHEPRAKVPVERNRATQQGRIMHRAK